MPVKFENVARFSTKDMEGAINQLQGYINRKERLAYHFTSKKAAARVISDGSFGLRASTEGQLGGGLFVCKTPPHEMGWDKYGGPAWREGVGKKLWGEKWEDVLLGGPDADKLEVVIIVKISYQVFDDPELAVDGRESILFIPDVNLTGHGDDFYLSKDFIVKVYAIDAITGLYLAAKDAQEVHLISTPYGNADGNGAGPNNDGAALAIKVKASLHRPPNVVCFNPNTDIGPIAEDRGWSKAEQEKKWLEIFMGLLRTAQEKKKQGSKVHLICCNKKPGDPDDGLTPELVGNAQRGELLAALIAGFNENDGSMVYEIFHRDGLRDPPPGSTTRSSTGAHRYNLRALLALGLAALSVALGAFGRVGALSWS